MNGMMTQRFVWLLVLLMTMLAACGGEPEPEVTPILPPPNISTGGVDAADTAVPLNPGTVSELPTLAPGETPTADPLATPTLEPTATSGATATAGPTAVTNPQTVAAAPGALPSTSRDLLFVADGAFKRWNHATRAIEVLIPGPDPASRVASDNQQPPFAGDITDFVVSPDGKRAVVAQLTASQVVTRSATYNGEPYLFTDSDQQHRLYFVDMVSNQVWTILARADNLRGLSLAPDAQYVTLVATSLDGVNVTNEDGTLRQNLYLLSTSGGNASVAQQVAACAGSCSAPAWHPADALFVWGDQTAVWLRALSGSAPESLWTNRPFNEQTGPDEVAVYAPIAWARNGRFLLMWHGGWEGGSRAVLDVPTRVMQDVPGTFVYVNVFPTQVMWMPDDRLFVLRSETPSGLLRPEAELWRFQPEQDALVKEESLLLSSQSLGAAGQQYLEDGRFAYALFSHDAANSGAGLYHLTSLTETPERVNAVPLVLPMPAVVQVWWTADGSGAVIQANDTGRVYYGAADGQALVEVTAVLGQNAHTFHWQPEIVVP